MDRSRVSPLVAALLLMTSPTAAQTRPLQTEPASTAPAGSLVFETGFDWISDERNPLTLSRRNRWDGPLLRFVYSPARNVELDLEWVAAVGAVRDPDFGSTSDTGDVSLRTKLRIVEEAQGRPAFGTRVSVTLPETRSLEGLGPDTLRARVDVLLTKHVGPVGLHANGGLLIQDLPRDAPEQVDFFAWGLALEHRFNPRFTALLEAAGRSGPGEPEARSRAEARLGARLERSRLAIDIAVRRGLSTADGDWGLTLGLAYRVRQPSFE